MFLSNLHTHTTYSDGTAPPEQYILAALKRGFVSLGFSEHTPTCYRCPCEMREERIPDYIAEITALKKKYAGQIEVLLGLEYDTYGPVDRIALGLDFEIGSVHYLQKSDGVYTAVDGTPEAIEELISDFGDIRGVAVEYYRLLCEVAQRRPEILGHFDLLTKFNSDNRFFNPDDAWYCEIVDNAIAQIAKSGVIVEVNTGAISRGYTKKPYPSEYILRSLHANRVPVTISADAHSPETLDFAFAEVEQLLRKVGYKSVKQYKGGRFVDVPL